MKAIRLLFFVLLGLTLFSSCVSKKKFDAETARANRLQDQLNACNKDKSALSAQIKELEGKIRKLENDTTLMGKGMRDLNRQLKEKDRQFANLKSDYDQMKSQTSKDILDKIDELNRLKSSLDDNTARLAELERLLKERDALLQALKDKLTKALKQFEEQGLTVYEQDGKIYVSMSDKLLFPSGKYHIKPDGQRAVKELSTVLNQNLEVSILVEGHTDNDKIRSSGTPPEDNWELSVLRATEVTRIMTAAGVDPKRVTASGHSEYMPRADNDNDAGKATNRRTEIILVPDYISILNQIKRRN